MEKKSERLEVRLGYQEKQSFTDACDMQGDTPSGAIRRFINGYVRRSDNDVLGTAWRGSAKRKLLPVLAVAGIVAISGVGIYAAINTWMQPSADEVFSFRDKNNDGELDYSELGLPPGRNSAPNDIFRVLDIDASETLSKTEFIQKGRMAYTLGEDRTSDASDENKMIATLVNFKFTKKRAESSTFIGATISANGLDRFVIWPVEGGPTVMEGRVKIKNDNENGDKEFQADNVITHKK